jgi:uncharacterized protein (DUF2147 family)
LAGAAGPPGPADRGVGHCTTSPARKALISQIEIRECDRALCGRIRAAFDRAGIPVTTRNVGRELFWGMRSRGDGTYSGGTAWIPLLNVEAAASMALSGSRLKVRGCARGLCQSQTWTRAR